MSRVFVAVLVMMLITASLSPLCACRPKTSPSPVVGEEKLPPPQTFKHDDIASEILYCSEWTKFFYDGINKRTQGRMKVDICWSLALGYKYGQQLQVVSQGLVPFSSGFVELYGSELPEFSMGMLPMLFGNIDEFEKFRQRFESKLAKVLLEKYNVVLLANMPQMGQSLMTKKPTRTLEDLKGQKIRMIAESGVLWLKELGVSAVSVALPEWYAALERGVIDGVISYPLGMWDYKIGEQVKYVPINYFCGGWWIYFCNKDTWDALPPLFKEAINDMNKETHDFALNRMHTGYPETMEKIRAMGVDFTELPASELKKARAVAMPIWDQYCDKHGPIAQEGLKIAKEVSGR